ncbi:MAG: hypothetical protein F6J97_13980 [Leptolyngbya sp. SIO4C1]|nr:hypothetical protein [Leptolyngbya sp. SIO4C1]
MISAQTPPDAVTVRSAYYAKLHPWCVIRQLPKLQRVVVARFRKGHDAEAHMKSLTRLVPQATFQVIFDPGDTLSAVAKADSAGIGAATPNPL